MTFNLPYPYQGDFLNSVTVRLKPLSWLPAEAYARLGVDWIPTRPADMWVWASALGSIALERAELEIDGVIVETFSGDWLHVWNKTAHTASRGVAFDDALYCNRIEAPTLNHTSVSDDGYVYVYLPFAFSKYTNTALPLVSCGGPHKIRFHITLRPLSDVVRKIGAPKCDARESPLGTSFEIRDYSFPFRKMRTIQTSVGTPGFETIDMLLSVSHIDGELRKAYIERPNEILLEPVVEMTFNEPLKYLITKSSSDTIHVGLPLTAANGPIKQILFFLRRKAAVDKYSEWTNYSAVLRHEADPVWNPKRPLLKRAQMMVGTAVWADDDEHWWRTHSALVQPGGVRAAGNYIYGYNFAEKPYTFDPSGSINTSRRADLLRLNLAVSAEAGDEWTVSVFLVGNNWLRFENGMANMVFMD
jgi:hypothetical protein